MPGHAPDHGLVRILNLVQHLAARRLPVDDLALTIPLGLVLAPRSARKQIFFEGMPSNHVDGVIVPLQTMNLLLCPSQIKKLDLLVSASSQEPVAIHWIPLCLGDLIVVCLNCVDAFASSTGVPNLHIVVFAASNAKRLKGMPLTAFYIRPVVLEGKLFSRCGEVEDLRSSVLGAGHELQTGLRKREVANAGFVVSLKLVFLLAQEIRVDDPALFVP